jgi:hypothetical protein
MKQGQEDSHPQSERNLSSCKRALKIIFCSTMVLKYLRKKKISALHMY